MAKKGTGPRSTRQGERTAKSMVDFAEDLGRLLGTAQAKASNWLNQRKDVIDELTQLRDTANRLLRDLTGGESPAGAGTRGRRGRRRAANGTTAAAGSSVAPARPGRRKMSAAARKAVSKRMRKFWAERRKTKTAQA
jgi:hypothetical protein